MCRRLSVAILLLEGLLLEFPWGGRGAFLQSAEALLLQLLLGQVLGQGLLQQLHLLLLLLLLREGAAAGGGGAAPRLGLTRGPLSAEGLQLQLLLRPPQQGQEQGAAVRGVEEERESEKPVTHLPSSTCSPCSGLRAARAARCQPRSSYAALPHAGEMMTPLQGAATCWSGLLNALAQWTAMQTLPPPSAAHETEVTG